MWLEHLLFGDYSVWMRKSDALKRAVCLSSFIISYGALPRAVKQGSSLTILEERDTRNQTRKEANEKSEKRIRVKNEYFRTTVS